MHPMDEIRFSKPSLRNQDVWPRGVRPGITRGLRRLVTVIIAIELAIGVVGWHAWTHIIK
jgi:hypothetical protein